MKDKISPRTARRTRRWCGGAVLSGVSGVSVSAYFREMRVLDPGKPRHGKALPWESPYRRLKRERKNPPSHPSHGRDGGGRWESSHEGLPVKTASKPLIRPARRPFSPIYAETKTPETSESTAFPYYRRNGRVPRARCSPDCPGLDRKA